MPEPTSHTQTRTSSNTYEQEGIKRLARPLHTFYDSGKHAFVSIDPEIIDQLNLTRNDVFVQEVHGENIVLRRFRNTLT